MTFNKKLLSIAVGTALGVSGTAYADLTPTTAIAAGGNVYAADSDLSSRIVGQQLVLTESVPAALGVGETVVLALDNGAKFVSATVTAGGGYAAAGNVTGAVSSGKLVLTVGTASTGTAGKITISAITLDTSAVSAGTALNVSRDASSTAAASTFTTSSVLLANAVSPSVTVAAVSSTVPNIKAGGTATLTDIKISELVPEAIKAGDSAAEVTITLPTGYTFASNSATSSTGTGFAITDDAAESGQGDMTIEVTGASSTDLASLTLGGTTDMTISAPSSATAGAVNATVTVKLKDGTTSTSTVQVATVTSAGITATGVASGAAFATSPTALTSTTLPKAPIGRNGAIAGNINVVENFADDLTVNDQLTITLPTGVTFGQNPEFYASNVTAAGSSPAGFSTMTVSVSALGTATQGGFIVGDTSSGAGTNDGNDLTINVADSVAAGEIQATISGTVGGTAITAQTVSIANAVATSASGTAASSIPVVGIGSSGAIGTVTVAESVGGALLANNSTITATLPSGVTWTSAPTAGSVSGITLVSTTASLSTDNSTATWQVSAASTAGGTAGSFTIAGNVTVASTHAGGSVSTTLGGTAGASGDVQIATASLGTSTAVGSIPTIVAGTPTQSLASLTITEAFAGALTGSKSFRLVLPAGFSWSAASLTATVSAGNAGAPSAASVATTFNSNDTLVVTTGTTSTTASTIKLSALKVNASPTAADGNISVQVLDGDTSGANTSGLVGGTYAMGLVGEPTALAASADSVSVTGTGTGSVTLTGGTGSLSITTLPDSAVATASLADGVLTVTGVAAGTTSLVVSDSSATPQTVTVAITVAAQGTEVDLGTGNTVTGATTDATFAGGASSDSGATITNGGTFAATDSLDVTATITVGTADVGTAGEILVLAGLNQGGGVMWYQKNASGAWVTWDGTVPGLVSSESVASLAATQTVNVATGLTGLAGDFTVFVGYQNASGDVIYTASPITFSVQ